MEKQPDEPEVITNEPLPSMSEPLEVQVAVTSTLATSSSQPITTASKSKAQRQREYRQRIAATRTPAEAAAARKYRTERQRYNRLRQAAKLAIASGSLEAQTKSSPKPAAPKTRAQIQREYRQRMAASITPEQAAAAREARNARERNNRLRQAANLAKAGGSLEAATTFHSGFTTVPIDNQRQFTDLQRQTLAIEPAESTVQPNTLDQIEVQVPSTWNTEWPSSDMRFKSTSLDNDFGYTCSVCERPRLSNDLKAITAAQLEDQTKMLIAKVYHYFEQEYEELKRMYGNLDLSPLSKFRERIALATGVSDSMLQQILEEERRREEEERTRAHKRRRQEDRAETLVVKIEQPEFNIDEPEIFVPDPLKTEPRDYDDNKTQLQNDHISVVVKTEPRNDEEENEQVPTVPISFHIKTEPQDDEIPIVSQELTKPGTSKHKERKRTRTSQNTSTQSSLLDVTEFKTETIDVHEKRFS